MSRAHRRGADAERAVARALGTTRTRNRSRFETAPDMAPVRLASGVTLVVESKARKSPPRWLLAAVEQAARYLPSAVPVAVISGRGARLAVLRLSDLAALVGLRALEPQIALPLSRVAPDAIDLACPAVPRESDPPCPQSTEVSR